MIRTYRRTALGPIDAVAGNDPDGAAWARRVRAASGKGWDGVADGDAA